MTRWLAILCLVLAPVAPVATAQLVAGPWVDRADARIEAHRKADLEVLVLGPGDRPAAGVEVRVRQLRHAFPFGAVLPADRPELIDRVGAPDRAVWRGLSAVSLARFAAWSVLQKEQAETDPAAAATLVGLLDAARARGLRVRLGPLAPGDPADRPAWAAGLPPERRLPAVLSFQASLAGLAAGRVHALDLVSSGASHPWLAPAGVRTLGQAAAAAHAPADAGGAGPQAWLGLGFEGAVDLDRGGAVLASAEALSLAFVPADGVTTGLRLARPASPEDLERAIQRLGTFGLDAAIHPLEAASDDPELPFTLEAALTLLFAEPRVREIHLAGFEAGLPGALLDTAGNPTAAGEGVDYLLARRWWTDAVATTDALGVARFRVFAGRHEVEAGGGPVEVAIAAGDAARVVAATAVR
ncbi:hypothetical protein [Phycisphaera mikurensis]|uniref:endo-1,4-beta-xylanase n=1 Tax=Phycisphaera mikurensis (strain NBRC 102666 / KCTC 22515 / FYK2301M01) TaxID=1142394 RepID=I0IDQ5_PHYMF|nr:hypothetical protein [Phycisphaera mikurensis]MBB6441208.1 hypothetical protein [Phycisphaera mikurensis]BAM03393.1 hypothetical protein PSMK_12340 [Phycisphaera mikurensis NBRC 102666]